MKLSRSAEYGLVAVGYIAREYKDGLVMAERVSKEYKIPLEYLLKIMQQLVRANVLRSKRGPRGGFTLARPPENITFLQIIEAVEGPVVTDMHLVELTGKEPFGLKVESVFRNTAEKVQQSYAKVKLTELLG